MAVLAIYLFSEEVSLSILGVGVLARDNILLSLLPVAVLLVVVLPVDIHSCVRPATFARW